jgi:hypothetical protein
MTQRAPASAADRSDPQTLFRLGSLGPAVTLLLILLFVGLIGVAFGAFLGTDVDIEPFAPEPGPDRVGEAASPEVAAGLEAWRTAERAQVGDPGDQPGGVPERFGPGDQGVVLVPDGWDVLARTEDSVTLGDGDGVRVLARIDRVSPSTPATQLVGERQAAILSPAGAADVRTSTVAGPQPFGSLVTRSAVGYSALRTDAQGVSSVGGNLFVFVRDDGLALTVEVEVSPATAWESRIEVWLPIWQNVVANFAGAPVPG